jgi:hypothetical protein
MSSQRTNRGRYVEREADDGEVTIYDTLNEDAWIRSDTTLSVECQT